MNSTGRKLFRRLCLIVILAGVLSMQTALAFDRFVVVNGQLMNTVQLAYLDALNGAYVPDGRYWLDLATGEWGYEGTPVQGVLGGYAPAEPEAQPQRSEPFEYDRIKDDFCVSNPGICP